MESRLQGVNPFPQPRQPQGPPPPVGQPTLPREKPSLAGHGDQTIDIDLAGHRFHQRTIQWKAPGPRGIGTPTGAIAIVETPHYGQTFLGQHLAQLDHMITIGDSR